MGSERPSCDELYKLLVSECIISAFVGKTRTREAWKAIAKAWKPGSLPKFLHYRVYSLQASEFFSSGVCSGPLLQASIWSIFIHGRERTASWHRAYSHLHF